MYNQSGGLHATKVKIQTQIMLNLNLALERATQSDSAEDRFLWLILLKHSRQLFKCAYTDESDKNLKEKCCVHTFLFFFTTNLPLTF